jgi:hypothetical protein
VNCAVSVTEFLSSTNVTIDSKWHKIHTRSTSSTFLWSIMGGANVPSGTRGDDEERKGKGRVGRGEKRGYWEGDGI